ncbi:MAG TPA: site-2 protease family protein [Candidatus Methylomirabilis sp.]|nr:site-2 protease family protein [Candidatus Methylomirabilis sp.]
MFDLPSISTLVITIPVFLLALTIHEFAHGWVANWLGDPTARLQGRLTLNPIAHLDPIGTLAIVFIGFGWARPVPVDARYLKRPQRDMMLIAAAGPGSNLLLAVVSAFCVRMIPWSVASPDWMWLVKPMLLMLYTSVGANVILAVFNLLPIPPLDGSRVLSGLLPLRQAINFSRLEPYGGIIIFLLFISGIMNPMFGLAQHTITRALLRMWG